ncbi:MAG TPA: hypothetical protein VHB73_01175 [Alphaproteobacteria bacterium]|nr:hypothetical protein [Alphaproteobacteria bacterium]
MSIPEWRKNKLRNEGAPLTHLSRASAIDLLRRVYNSLDTADWIIFTRKKEVNGLIVRLGGAPEIVQASGASRRKRKSHALNEPALAPPKTQTLFQFPQGGNRRASSANQGV